MASSTSGPGDSALYAPGQTLHLQTLRTLHRPHLPHDVTATINHVYSMTMSPVMDVTIPGPDGSPERAVLKLYDRQTGTSLRKIRNEYAPHSPENEAALHSFIRQGKMDDFVAYLAKDRREELLPHRPYEFLDDDMPDGLARFEAALWWQANEHFCCETKAYEKLASLQGRSIPRMYAHVRLSRPADELVDPRVAPYLEIKGILIQRISGYDLFDLPVSSLAPADSSAWLGIVQQAMDAAHAINKLGVIMEDCDPGNAVVEGGSQAPFIIDLAQCRFKDEVMKEWEENGPGEWDDWDEKDGWDPEVQWWTQVAATNNPAAMGGIVAKRVKREMGVVLEVQYTDHGKIIDSIRAKTRAG